MLLNNIVKLLFEAYNSQGKERESKIKKVQELIWEDQTINDEKLNDILTDIAYNLDFYEPNEEWRKENPSFYGDEKLEKEIRGSLKKIDAYKSNQSK